MIWALEVWQLEIVRRLCRLANAANKRHQHLSDVRIWTIRKEIESIASGSQGDELFVRELPNKGAELYI